MNSQFASSPPGEYIQKVSVKKLYGEFDYALGPIEPGANPRVLVFYGNNGTGKTTILKLIRDLLSSEFDAGCRTRLASTQFESVTITFVSGAIVEAVRKSGEIEGAFRWIVRRPNSNALELNVGNRAKNLSRIEEMDPNFRESYQKIQETVKALVPEINYLDDKRTFFVNDDKETSPGYVVHRMNDGSTRRVLVSSRTDDSDPVSVVLSTLMNAVRREAFLRTNRGSSNAQSIYTALVDRLSVGRWRETANQQGSLEGLADKLRKVQLESETLSVYGLVAPLDHVEMENALHSAGQESAAIIAEVLTPYIESMTARFDVLQTLYKDIDAWVSNVNKFLMPKRIRLKVGEDLQILSKASQDLGVDTLSSGERHLMLMMGKAFLMRSTSGLMMIDEPEISLNVKWQRDLVRALVEAFGGSGVQLIIATHSLEIASLYLGNVLKLDDEINTESSQQG